MNINGLESTTQFAKLVHFGCAHLHSSAVAELCSFLTVYNLERNIAEVIIDAGQLSPSVIALQFKGRLPSFSNNLTRIVSAVPGYKIRAVAAEVQMSRVILDTPKVSEFDCHAED